MVTIINGDGLLLGRLASITASRALAGEEIAIVNVEKVIISGSRARVLANYRHKRERGASGDRWGPFVPRRPDHLMKRTIRGMLPYKRPRGVLAMTIGWPGVEQSRASRPICWLCFTTHLAHACTSLRCCGCAETLGKRT